MASLWSEQQVLAAEPKAAAEHATSRARIHAERENEHNVSREEAPLSKRARIQSEHQVLLPLTSSQNTVSQPLKHLAYNVFAKGVKTKLPTQLTRGISDVGNEGSVKVTHEGKITAVNPLHKNLNSDNIESFVVFDMETGGKWHHVDNILQIVAKHGDGYSTFTYSPLDVCGLRLHW